MNKLFAGTITLIILGFSAIYPVAAQPRSDSVSIDFPKVFGLALNGNIPEMLNFMESTPDQLLIKKHLIVKDQIKARFSHLEDQSDYDFKHSSVLDSLLAIYKSYWRKSFLNFPQNYDTELKNELKVFLRLNSEADKHDAERDSSISDRLKRYVLSKGYHSIGFSRIGKYYDLIVWRTETDTIYKFKINKETIKSRVIFMDDFVSLGWQEYATADKIHPGGWAEKTGLFCVKKSYDLNSEAFLISYLAHEGRHFKDYVEFPKLSNADLEYRAKLTELSMADLTMFNLIQFFIGTSNKESTDGHQIANYYIIRDLSMPLFNSGFQNNSDEWKKLDRAEIRKAARMLIEKNNHHLKKFHSYITLKPN